MPRITFADLAKVGLFARTVIQLRKKQAAYAIYRQLRPKSPPHAQRDAIKIRRRAGSCDPIMHVDDLGRPNVLRFIGTEKSVEDGIDWRSSDMSRLWRYHLQYFDYLCDDYRTTHWKRAAIDTWIIANPLGTLDAWEPYPISLRIVNWVKFFDKLARESVDIEPHWLESLYQQVLWLEHNIEWHVLANHLLKNAKALIYAGTFFDGSDAKRWSDCGMRILRSQIDEQFLPDGGHFERSPMYHVMCVEDLLDILNIGSTDPSPMTKESIEGIRTCASAGLTFLDAILMPDGEIPLFNDAALGMATTPIALFEYARRLMVFDRLRDDSRPLTSALADTGYYVMRDGDDMLIIDCGEIGPRYQPGHAHCDMLSYELALDGDRLIVDTGVYDYEASPRRRFVRSTAAHNTVSVDGHDQSEVWGVFRVGRRAHPIRPRLQRMKEGVVRFEGGHDGFRALVGHVRHRRTITYTGGSYYFEDRIEGRGIHLVENRIHLAPGLEALYRGSAIDVFDAAGRLRATITVSTVANIAVSIEMGFYYPRFGTALSRSVLVMMGYAQLPVTIGYTIESATRG